MNQQLTINGKMAKKIDLEIKVPKNWKGVTLRKYLDLVRDMEVYKETPEAVDAALFHHLGGVDPKYLSKLDISIYMDIKEKYYSLMNIKDVDHTRRFFHKGVEYGFEPNLSEMAYGAYVDLQKYEEVKIDDNWSEIMSILYRPVTNKIGELYEIEPYGAKIDKELFLDVDMNIHFGALFFFLHTLTDCLNFIQNSSKEKLLKLVQHTNIPSTKNGEHTRQFISYLKGIS